MIPGLYEIFNERWCHQTVWVSSDWHFGDQELRAGKPDRISDEELVKLLNSKCGRKDTLICLGDVGDPGYVRKLRAGYKILIAGNHDAGMENYKRKIITQKFDKEIYQKDEALLEMKRLYPNCKYDIEEGYDFHSPFEYWKVCADNGLFDEVYSGALIIGEKLILSHEPIKQDWALNLHGHDHQHAESDIYHKNVCIDVAGAEPLNLNRFMKSGPASKIQSVHRQTIDGATVRARKRGYKLGQKKG